MALRYYLKLPPLQYSQTKYIFLLDLSYIIRTYAEISVPLYTMIYIFAYWLFLLLVSEKMPQGCYLISLFSQRILFLLLSASCSFNQIPKKPIRRLLSPASSPYWTHSWLALFFSNRIQIFLASYNLNLGIN